MAVDTTQTTTEAPAGGGAPKALDSAMTKVAAIVSLALTAAALFGLIMFWITHSEAAASIVLMMIVKIVFLVGMAGAGAILLLREKVWAQQTLLVIWLLTAGNATVMLLLDHLWDTPHWWKQIMQDWPVWAVMVPTLGASAAAVVVLVMASAAKSRARYASMVGVSVVTAAILIVGLNMVFQQDAKKGGFGWRKDLESLGRYGITDRTVKILSALEQEIKLTCVYLPDPAADNDGSEPVNPHHDEVWEYLEGLKKQMEREGKTVEITDVTTPVGQVKLQRRLRKRHRDAQQAHVTLLEVDFLPNSASMVKALKAAETRWGEMPDDAFLTQFGLSAGVAESFRSSAKRVGEIANAIRAAEDDTSALPDYADLTTQLKEALDNTQSNMETIIKIVKKVKGIPAPVAKSRKGVLDAMAKADRAVAAMSKTLDGVADGKVTAEQAAGVLTAFAKAAPPAAEELRVAADALRLAAGEDNAGVIRGSAYFSMAMVVPLPDGSTATSREDLVTNIEQIMAPRIEELGRVATEIVKRLKPETQLENLKGVASLTDHWAKQFGRVQTRTVQALDALAKPDKDTAAAFKQAEDGTLFKALIEPVKTIVDAAGKLPDVSDAALSSAVTESNIVIVEVGEKTKVATFDEVFPKQQRLGDRGPGTAGGERAFNGDSAIASKMLKMGRGPFGTVIVAHFDPPPQMMGGRRPMPRAPLPLPPNNLTELTKAIEASNYKVEQWNMSNPDAKPKLDASEPKILLVLPPPPASPFGGMMGMPKSPQFGPGQVAQIRSEIDAGTPAVFLMTYQPTREASMGFGAPRMPVPPNTEVHTYLEADWGIEIVRDARVIVGNPDKTQPGWFKINVEAFTYLPISTFSDHAIGAPLQGQRVFWLDACPITTAEAVDDVTIAPLLTIGGDLANIWATRVQIGELVEAIRSGGGLIKPSYGQPGSDDGDLRTPMDLAVAATRTADPESSRSESKIVVLTVGGSMLDWYVSRPIGVADGKGGFSFDKPPTINTTLVVNSLYWLTDKSDYIAAGPGSVKTIGTIDKGTETVLKVLCLAGFPLIILVAGGVVMFFRRR